MIHLHGPLVDDHVAGEARAGTADVEVTIAPLGEARAAFERADGHTGTHAVGKTGSVIAHSNHARRRRRRVHIEDRIVGENELTGGEDRTVAIVRHAQHRIDGAIATCLSDLNVANRMDAIIGTWIPVDDCVVHRDDLAERVAVVQQRVAWLGTKVQLCRPDLATIESDGVRDARIARRTEGVELERSFVHHPAIAITIAGAACAIALVIRNDQGVRTELGDTTGGEIAVQGEITTHSIDQCLTRPRGTELHVRINGAAAIHDDAAHVATDAAEGDRAFVIRTCDAIHGEATEAHRKDAWIVEQRRRGLNVDNGRGRQSGGIRCHCGITHRSKPIGTIRGETVLHLNTEVTRQHVRACYIGRCCAGHDESLAVGAWRAAQPVNSGRNEHQCAAIRTGDTRCIEGDLRRALRHRLNA